MFTFFQEDIMTKTAAFANSDATSSSISDTIPPVLLEFVNVQFVEFVLSVANPVLLEFVDVRFVSCKP